MDCAHGVVTYKYAFYKNLLALCALNNFSFVCDMNVFNSRIFVNVFVVCLNRGKKIFFVMF